MSELTRNTAILLDVEFNESIRQDLSSKNIDNSRAAANSLRVEETKNGARSVGVFYLIFLDQGRGPGKFPPVDVITGWAANKPVEIDPFLIGRKIAREGTEIYKNRSKGIMLDEKRKALLEKLKELAPKWAKQDVLIQLKNINKKIQ